MNRNSNDTPIIDIGSLTRLFYQPISIDSPLIFTIFSHSYSFIASPVNIFNLNEEMETSSINGSYAPQSIWDMFVRYYMQYEGGPMLYTSDSHYHLRPYGMMLNYVGNTKSSNITLNFSQNQASNNQKCYIYIKQN